MDTFKTQGNFFGQQSRTKSPYTAGQPFGLQSGLQTNSQIGFRVLGQQQQQSHPHQDRQGSFYTEQNQPIQYSYQQQPQPQNQHQYIDPQQHFNKNSVQQQYGSGEVPHLQQVRSQPSLSQNYIIGEIEKILQSSSNPNYTNTQKSIISRIEQLKIENERYRSEVPRLQAQLTHSQQQQQQQQQQPNLNDQKQKIQILETNLKNLMQENSEITQELQKKQVRILSSQDELRASQKQIQILMKDIDNLRNNQVIINGNQDNKNQNLENENQKKDEKIRQLEQQIYELKKEKDTIQRDYTQVINQLRVKSAEERELEDLRQQYNKQYEQLMVEIQKNNELQGKLDNQIKQHNNKVKVLEEIINNNNVQDIGSVDNNNNNNLENQIQQIRQELNEKERVLRENQAELNKHIQRLEQQDKLIKEKSQEIINQQQIIYQQEKYILEKDNEVKSKIKQIGEYQQNVLEKDNEIKQKNKIIGDQEKIIQEKSNLINEIDRKLIEGQKIIEDLNKEIQQKQQKIQDIEISLKQSNVYLKTKNKEIEDQTSNVNEREKQLQEEVKGLQQKNKLLEDQLNQNQNKIKQIEDDLSKSQNEIAKNQQELDQQLKQSQSDKQQYNNLKQKLQDNENIIQTFNQDKLLLEKQIEKQNLQIQNIQQQAQNTLQNDKEQLKQQLDSAQNKIHELNDINNQLNEEINYLRGQIEEIQDNFDDSEKQQLLALLEKEKEKIEELQNQNIKLEEESGQRDEQIEFLEQQLKLLQNSSNKQKGLEGSKANEADNNNSFVQVNNDDEEGAQRYDVILRAGLLQELVNGWQVNVKDPEEYNEVKEQQGIVISILGSTKVGKTFISQKIFGQKLIVPKELCSDDNLCIGVSYGVMENGVLVLQETCNFDRAIEWPNKNQKNGEEEIINEEGEDEQQEMQNPEEVARNEELFDICLKDRCLSENLLQEFVVDRADVIIIVLNELTINDQKLLARYRKKFREKYLIIIHNWKNSKTIEDVSQKIHNYILQPFNVETKRIINDNEQNPKNTTIFCDKVFAENIIHLILAREGTEAGQYFNESTIDYLVSLLWTLKGTRNYDILEEIKKCLHENIELYTEVSKEQIGQVPDEQDPNTVLLVSQQPVLLKKIPVDELGEIQLLQAGQQLKYSLSVNDRFITLRIDTPGFNIESENLSLEMDEENQYIIIEVERQLDIDETQENVLVNSREFGRFRLMTLGIPLSAFVIETSEEPAVINSDGLCVIQLAYKRTDQPEYDEYDEDNGDAE